MYKPIKELGQNFLVDKNISRDVVDALEVVDGDEIIEIGPGHGAVTEALGNRVKGTKSVVRAVEVDERFIGKLVNMFLYDPNVKIVEDNILDYLPDYEPQGEFKIIGSLPYYITSPILHVVIKMEKLPKICVFLIQDEVAIKVSSTSPDASYLSSFTQTFFDVEYLFKVEKDMFKPEPKVNGAVIKLVRRDANYDRKFIEKYEGFLHKGFASPRKMLNKQFTKDELEKGGIHASLRPQNLSADEWVKFFEDLHNEV